ncbi:hypothetical protein APHAL10511_003108 [Amanita phalloides]|nr:hypothetical protein APHAL10511_003108 [Amanita phalloides]
MTLWHANPQLVREDGADLAAASQLTAFTSRAQALFTTPIPAPSSETRFLSNIVHSGTLSDRLSALTLLVQSDPVHNVKALDSLKAMAEHGRDESLKALRCVVDWWVGGGAPDRKLKYFRDQPLLHRSVTDQHLIVWYFEDWLKKYFFSILQILEALSLDPLPYVRVQAISLVFTLLRDKPEQEQNLLRLLVNKLGDTEKSICSKGSYYLLQLLQTHPAMKAVVVREIISLVLKPPSSKTASHARYYSMITLNQFVLTQADRQVARQLLDIYFKMFKEVLGESNDEKNEKEDKDEKSVKLDKSGRVIDGGRKGIKKKGKKQFKGAAGFAEVEDVNAKLLSATLTGVNRALPFAKVDGTDSNIGRHIDTLFLITHKSTFNISLQALVLIQQISSSSSISKTIKDRYYRALYASLHDVRLSTSSKQAMYLNLLFKSIKADAENMDRVVALVRRFIQVLVSGGSGATEVVVGGLYLLGELFSSVPGLRSTLHPSSSKQEPYDSRKRDPQYAHARASPIWELTPLLHHYHPAVSLHARQLLLSLPVTSNPDLTQNTLSHFLDRFVYKNPKKAKAGEEGSVRTRGGSAMQPAASGLDGLGVKMMRTDADGASMRNHGAVFESDVPADQVFFHRFFKKKSEATKKKKKKKRERTESGTDEEGTELGDEEAVWKAMKATMPKAAGDEEMCEESEDELVEGSDEDELVEESDEGELVELVEESDEEELGSVEEWGGFEVGTKRKRRKEERKGGGKRRRGMGTFASYEEYAEMIEEASIGLY